jgi:hypothetical protein
MTTILSYGGGVDSTALLAMHLNRDRAAAALGIDRAALDAALPTFDAVMFSDPGAEFQSTYKTIETAKALCAAAGLPFHQVRREGETISEQMLRLGTIPLMPGGPHVCSRKFKGDVLEREAKKLYGEGVQWVIGIEASEGHRLTRFQGAKGSVQPLYPLVTLGMDREACERMNGLLWPEPVFKSSCVFCPFMADWEIKRAIKECPEDWKLAKKVEAAFREASARKHQAWLDAGKPLNKAGRAPVGMWRQDSWANGQRLFARKVNGKALSCEEWEAHFANE